MKKSILIGHLSDLHLNGRADRRACFVRGLERARGMGVGHLVLTGDLTKSGKPEQFGELAGCLEGWRGEDVTIIPGNHDEGHAFDRALGGGVLKRFEAASKGVVSREGFRILPLDTRFHGRALAFRAIGKIGTQQMGRVAEAVADRSAPLLIAQHHGPHFHWMNMLHGLTDRLGVLKLLESREDVHVLAGHDHVIQDLHGDRIHVAASVAHHPDPLRVYRFVGTRLEHVHRSTGGGFLTIGRIG
jgi:3',5'-cyclic AMP phosphodiesterase CpdA